MFKSGEIWQCFGGFNLVNNQRNGDHFDPKFAFKCAGVDLLTFVNADFPLNIDAVLTC